MLLDEASVTGTANIIMASRARQGHDDDLQCGLRALHPAALPSAQPHGRQHQRHRFQPVDDCRGDKLHGASHHHILPDMIEVGSFIGMAAMVGNGVRIKDVSLRNLGPFPTPSAAWASR
jgi:UDP-N-acetylglucosamine 1-carboxyvinyltransferase